jgi:hypothetical protein
MGSGLAIVMIYTLSEVEVIDPDWKERMNLGQGEARSPLFNLLPAILSSPAPVKSATAYPKKQKEEVVNRGCLREGK